MTTESDEIIKELDNYIAKLIPDERIRSLDSVQSDLIKMGINRIGHSRRYGGLAFSIADQIKVSATLGRTRLRFRNTVGYTATLAAFVIDRYAKPELAKEILGEVNKGANISFALTEPKSGSTVSTMESSYFEDSGRYFLTGDKNFIGNSTVSSHFIIFAKSGRKISAFLVHRDHIMIDAPLETMGQGGIDVCNIHFALAEGTLIASEGDGGRILRETVMHSRVIMGAVALGMATRALDYTVHFANIRGTGKHQLVRGLLADSYTDMLAMSGMLQSYEEYDESIHAIESSAIKLFTSRALNRILDNCIQVMGGYGLVQDNIVEEFYRDARVFRIYEGTDEMQQLEIARIILL